MTLIMGLRNCSDVIT